MLGRLSGELIFHKPPRIMLDISGIGYEIDMPIPDCTTLPSIGNKVTLYTHLIIREDVHALYGFNTIASRDCFRTLLKVSGIGPRIALALLSTLTPTQLNVALEQADSTTLIRTPGIGKKMADRMILELKGHLNLDVADEDNKVTPKSSLRSDIANALVSLGYNDREINKVMQILPIGISELGLGIKEALRLLNQKSS